MYFMTLNSVTVSKEQAGGCLFGAAVVRDCQASPAIGRGSGQERVGWGARSGKGDSFRCSSMQPGGLEAHKWVLEVGPPTGLSEGAYLAFPGWSQIGLEHKS